MLKSQPLVMSKLLPGRSPYLAATAATRRGLALRKGEILIDSIGSVEDTKGNNGERGELVCQPMEHTSWQRPSRM